MKRLLSYIGAFLTISGIVSSILYLFDYNLSLLSWIDSWGGIKGWIIRGVMIVVGILLFFYGGNSSDDEEAAQED